MTLPDKVELKIEDASVVIKGPKGQLSYEPSKSIKVQLEGKEVSISPANDSPESLSMWGTTRTLIHNMIIGVSVGFTKKLEFNGVGYKASIKGKVLNLSLGYSHPINYQLPEGVEAKVSKNIIEILGPDKQLVGLVAAKVRSFRPPEPYKGKGIKYVDERIVMKAGKSGGKK